MYSFTFRYDEHQVRRHYMRELWRTQGLGLVLIPLLLAAAVPAALDPQFQWLAGLLVGGSLTYALFLYSSYTQAQRRLRNRAVEARVGEDECEFVFGDASSRIAWSGIAAVRETRDGLVLVLRDGDHAVLLPSTAMPAEALALIRRKADDQP